MEALNMIALFVWALESFRIQRSNVYVKKDIMMMRYIQIAKVNII
jgi:hypothetical protein